MQSVTICESNAQPKEYTFYTYLVVKRKRKKEMRLYGFN